MLVRRGTVSVWSTEIIGISSSGTEFVERFAMFGEVHLHLKGGGQIDINTTDPDTEKQEWERLLGWSE